MATTPVLNETAGACICQRMGMACEWQCQDTTRQHKRVCSLTRSYLDSSGDFRRAHGQTQTSKTEKQCGDVCFVSAVSKLRFVDHSSQKATRHLAARADIGRATMCMNTICSRISSRLLSKAKCHSRCNEISSRADKQKRHVGECLISGRSEASNITLFVRATIPSWSPFDRGQP